MDSEFIIYRILHLISQNNISKSKMSRDLGHDKSYIDNIISGRHILNMSELIAICDYFQITLPEFLGDKCKNPELLQRISAELKNMDEYDLMLILRIIQRLKK